MLVLHGGKSNSLAPTRPGQLAYRRMVPIARAVYGAVGGAGGDVWLVRNRVRGWNAPDLDAVRDARWALTVLRERHPGVPVVLVGHSMGARAALHVADDPAVVAVCALAPWIEPGEPVDQLAGRTLLMAHGTRDRWTSAGRSFGYAVRARRVADRVARFELRGAGHFMLRRAGDWTGLATHFAAAALGATEEHPMIAGAFDAPTPDGLRLSLPGGAL